MKVYFNLKNEWVLLNNDTDFINGYCVSDFAYNLMENKYKLDNFVVKVQYNNTKYATDFSNLIFENIEE